MSKKKRQLRVFLCHARQDKKVVYDLFVRLKNDGVDVWLDKEKLLPGLDWEGEIRRAVQNSDIVIVCLSKKFSRAGYRQREVRIALDAANLQPQGEIFIIPARLEECNTLDSLIKWQYVDLFEEDGYRQLMGALKVRASRHGIILDAKQKNRQSLVQDLMIRRPVTVDSEDSVEFVRRVMEAKNINYVLIPPQFGGRVWRIFTKTDLLIALNEQEDLSNVAIESVTSQVTFVARPEWTWQRVLREMVQNGVKHLPVIDRDGTLVGIISSDDVAYL